MAVACRPAAGAVEASVAAEGERREASERPGLRDGAPFLQRRLERHGLSCEEGGDANP